MLKIPKNPILDRLPAHLHQYIIPQDYDGYTSENQAVWRYVMRKNINFLSKVAHRTYVAGLKKTGVSIEDIPDMYGMNRILKDIGWAAAAVDGFIPPAAFMEFQAYNVLVIAADIRTLEHIEYTPAPDIIHEAAGHAPIIANPEYAEYLRRLGEIGSKAISSSHDWNLYEAVRKLSQLKELETPDLDAIDRAQQDVDLLQQEETQMSEMAMIRNLQWWSVEYGLIGELDDFKIYGAGLLSSIGESEWCMSEKVEKLPYTIEAASVNFDITRPQPHLFVTPDFAHLSYVLDELANTLALRKGGLNGIEKLIDSRRLGTIELSTGLQISGVFSKVIAYNDQPVYVQTDGPSVLANRDRALIGHSVLEHPSGFGSPLGRLKGINIPIEDMSPRDLEAYDIYEGRKVNLEFEGSIFLSGEVVTGTRNLKGKILLITFKNCTIKHKDEVLFTPEMGIFHMAVGREVVSAFAGPADITSFDLKDHELSNSERQSVRTLLEEHKLRCYSAIKRYRNSGADESELKNLYHEIKESHSDQWLLLLELYELFRLSEKDKWIASTFKLLENFMNSHPEKRHLVQDGLKMINSMQEVHV